MSSIVCPSCGFPKPKRGTCPTCGRGPRVQRAGARARTRTNAAVIARDGLVCAICHQAVDRADVQIDHHIPLSLGGSDRLDNLRVTHARCNREKGDR